VTLPRTLAPAPAMDPTAFVALDFTTHVVENYSHDDGVAERAAQALKLARASSLPVFHVVSARRRADIHPMLAPAAGEYVLGKTTIGAFATTPLHLLLQDAGIGQIIVAGIATSGTVLSTTRWAFDVGYHVIVCADACADPDPDVHAALVDQNIYPSSWLGLWRIANVLPTADIPLM
jgi:nicotinamidase-related amidase